MASTEEEIKEMLKGKLYPGQAVKVESWASRSMSSYVYKGCRRGIVAALYPHIFTVRIGRYLESFRYSQCIEQNQERVTLI